MTNFSDSFLSNNAFLPFYEEPVQISTKEMNITLYTCVFQDDNMDALGDGDFESDVEQINIHIKPTDANLVRKVRRGDQVSMKNGKVFFVTEVVDDRGVGMLIKARAGK